MVAGSAFELWWWGLAMLPPLVGAAGGRRDQWAGSGGGSPFGHGTVFGGGWGWLWTWRSSGRGSANRAFADVAETEDAEQRYFDFAGTAEKLEQDGDSFAGGHDAGHGTGDASERAIADFDLIAGENRCCDDQWFITGDGNPQLIDDTGGDSGHGMAEVDLAGDATGGEDGALPERPVAAGEDVAGKEGFGKPDRASRGFFAMAQPWAKRLNFPRSERNHLSGGQMFALRLGA